MLRFTEHWRGDVLLYVLVVLGGFFIYFLYKHILFTRLYNRVRWILTGNSSKLDVERLYNRLKRHCKENEFPIKYFFANDEEKKIIYRLLEIYQQELMQNMICGHLLSTLQLMSLNYEEYFWLSFYNFLIKYESDSHFLVKYNLPDFVIYKSGDAHTKTYSLTDFGIVYNKALYIVHFLCQKNKKVSKLVTHDADKHKETLDSNEISFIKYERGSYR